MIFSFSVPENERNKLLISWYKTSDPQERSRRFREILLSYLGEDRNNNVTQPQTHISRSITLAKMARIDITNNIADDVDLESRLDSIGILGGELN